MIEKITTLGEFTKSGCYYLLNIFLCDQSHAQATDSFFEATNPTPKRLIPSSKRPIPRLSDRFTHRSDQSHAQATDTFIEATDPHN